MLAAISVLFLAALVASADAWGKDGHEIVSTIASNLLSKRLLRLTSEVLNGETLVDVANWADQVAADMPWSYSLHFINVLQDPCEAGGGCSFDYERDCADDVCVAGAIMNYSTTLHSAFPHEVNSTSADESLRFLVHYVGDIHQPLHSARGADRGGNTIDVTFDVPGQGTQWNLHNVWDFGIIVRSMEDDFDGDQGLFTDNLMQLLDSTWAEESKEWTECVRKGRSMDDLQICVSHWGEESLQAALEEAYLDENGEEIEESAEISDEYYKERLPTVQQRLLMSGVRLAATLELLFK